MEPRVTTDDLKAALAHQDPTERAFAFDRYSKQKPTLDAIPILRRALADEYHYTVRAAAVALRKLGPSASEAWADLVAAASQIDLLTRMPQAYSECLEALISIDPSHPELIALIKKFIELDNWIPMSASLRALRTIGTPEAIDLFERMATFWQPKLNVTQRRLVERLRDG